MTLPRIDKDTPKRNPMKNKPTIAELEKLLQQDEDVPLEILQNGEIRAISKSRRRKKGELKPITMKENLGGEYAVAFNYS